MNHVTLYKPLGKTPLEVIQDFKAKNPGYANVKLAYAGRLDPMAEGILLILVGDECKKRKSYERLPKIYEFEVLFGVSTDTYDLLGIASHRLQSFQANKLRKLIPSLVGKQTQAYPPYSAARVNGKPLFYWARNNKLSKINIPEKQIEIYSLTLENIRTIKLDNLKDLVFEKLEKVSGNFRQEEIKKTWNSFFTHTKQSEFQVAKFEVKCSSGTYVRSIANHMGEKLGAGACAYSIKRTSIGNFQIT